MSLSKEERQIVVNREMEKAQNTFDDMLFCAKEGKWEAAANRLYYSLFHAVSALLINDGHSVKSHRGILALFGEHYIRTGIFSKKDGSLLSDLVIMRDNADYNCFYEASEEKLTPFIEPTQQLIEKIKQFINNK
ncbi:MAG: HEPN domain-containing protein [Prevotella sp.]|nr:HEPN domain-containing protein [Prevotella sp.]